MSDIYQGSGQLTGNLERSDNVLLRGRVTLTATGQGPSSIYAPYYYVSYSKDIEFLNINLLRPRIEVWEADASTAPFNTHRACPYTQWRTGARDIQRIVNVTLFTSPVTKTSGPLVRLIIEMFSSTQNVERTFFYTVFNETVATTDGTLYPTDGSFT